MKVANIVLSISLVSATNPTHYGDPKTGCAADERLVELPGISGDFCAPKCSPITICPTDLPSGDTAKPTCALQTGSGAMYCALICRPFDTRTQGECGTGTCQSIQDTGICTYAKSEGNDHVAAALVLPKTNPTHYGDPKTGCEADEQAVQVQGLSGDFCTPKCSSTGSCPTDVPSGDTAKPTCALQTTTGDKFCALICTPSAMRMNGAAGECGTGTCQTLQGTGLCTYAKSEGNVHVATSFVQTDANPVVADVPDDEYEREFVNFERRFNKVYASFQERWSRFKKFKSTYMYIASENAKGTNLYELGVNEFADLTPDEFSETHFGFSKPKQVWGGLPRLGTHEYSGAPLATSIDWTKKGAVTAAKNQGQCGSCWSFSTTGSLEGAWKIAGHELVSLSEQQLVECSEKNHGCQGGSMDLAFQFEEGMNVCTEASYPYTSGGGQTGSCKASSCKTGIPKGGVTGFKDVAQNSEQALMEAVSQQPVSIAVEADKPVFQSYKSGIMTGVCGSTLDHGILVVGYGSENAQDYWLVKNSWGAAWGEQGFGKLLRGKGTSGECGILSMASYPVVSTAEGHSDEHSFEAFKTKFGKAYEGAENTKRAALFAAKVLEVEAHNEEHAAGKHTWWKAINEFADWSPEEFKAIHGKKRGHEMGPLPVDTSLTGPEPNPLTVDWRTKNAVTAVKNQGGCGSCWAFSATETLESHYAIASGKLVELSPQAIVDCVVNPGHCGGTGGCEGATMELAFNVTRTKGIPLEKDLPYQGRDAPCPSYKPAVVADGYVKLPVNDPRALETALATKGPISITVAAEPWMSYGGGIFNGCTGTGTNSGTDLDHGVQAVGYTQEYWIVRNSWGPTWGEAGFIYLSRANDHKVLKDTTPADGVACRPLPPFQEVGGECGMLFDTSYPTGVRAATTDIIV